MTFKTSDSRYPCFILNILENDMSNNEDTISHTETKKQFLETFCIVHVDM